jgi:Toastrack DUF4097
MMKLRNLLCLTLLILTSFAFAAEPTEAEQTVESEDVAEPIDQGERLPLTRTLEATVPLDGSGRFRMQLDSADIRLVAADREDIAISLELESVKLFIFSNRRTTWAIHRAGIVSTMEGGVLELGIDFPVRVDDDWLNSTWVIELPRQLAVEVDINSGTVDVTGLEGGVTINVVSGAIDVDVPSGPLDLRSVNGAIDARVGASEYATLTMKLVNGSADLTVDGVEQESDFSDDVNLEGSGVHALYLETVNGGISLELGR